MSSFADEDPTMPVDLENSTSIGQLEDVTFGMSAQRRDRESLSSLDKMSSGRRSPVRARTMKEYDQEMADLKKENFDLKLRIYFLEDRMKIHSRGDEFKLNIELNVQVESLKKDLMDKQELLRQATTALDAHLAQCEVQRERARAEGFGEGRALQAHLEGQLSERQKALETAEEALHAMRKQLESAVDVKLADALRHETAEKENELDRLRKERIDYEEQVVRRLQINVHELEEALRDRDAAIERLTSELRSATLLQNQSAGQQKDYELELDEQRRQIDEFKVLVDQFGRECSTKDQRLQMLEQDLLQKEQEAKDLKNSLARINKENSEKQEGAEARYQALLDESRRQAATKDRAVERLSRQLQEVEQQLQASSELAERQHAAAAGQAAERRDSIITGLREKLQDKERHAEALVEEKFRLMEEKDAQIQALRVTLRQKDRDMEELKRQLSLLSGEVEIKDQERREQEKAARELATSLKIAQRSAEAGADGYKRELDERNNTIKRLEETLRSRDLQIIAMQAAADERPTEAVVVELRRLLAAKDKQLSDALSERSEASAASEQAAAELVDKLRHKDAQMKMMTDKYTKEMRNLEEQLLQLQLELGRKSYELQAFSGHLRGNSDASADILDHLRAALLEKDKTIAALVESSKEKDALLRRWQESGLAGGGLPGSPAQLTLLLPPHAVNAAASPQTLRHAGSAPDDAAEQELQRLRAEVKYLRELLLRPDSGASGVTSTDSSPRSHRSHSTAGRGRASGHRLKPARPSALAGLLKDLLRAERELYESLKQRLDSSPTSSDKERSLEAALRDMATLRDRAVASLAESDRLRTVLELRLGTLEHDTSAPPFSSMATAAAAPGVLSSSSGSSASSHNAESVAEDGRHHVRRPPAEPKTPSRRQPSSDARDVDEHDEDHDLVESADGVSVADARMMVATRLARAKTKVRSLEERLLMLSNEAVDGAVAPLSAEAITEQVVKRLETAEQENKRLQGELVDARRRTESLDSVAALLRRQLQLNTQTPDLPSGFNPDLIVSMAQEIERLKKRLGGTAAAAKSDVAVGSDTDGTESESAAPDDEEVESLRRQLASSRNIISLLKRQIELNSSSSNGSSAMSFNPQLIVDMAAEIERLKDEQRHRRQQQLKPPQWHAEGTGAAGEMTLQLFGGTTEGNRPVDGSGHSAAESSGTKPLAFVSRHKSGIPLPVRATRAPAGSAQRSAEADGVDPPTPELDSNTFMQQLLEAQAQARRLEQKLAATESTVRQQSRKARLYRKLLEQAGLASPAAVSASANGSHSRSASESDLVDAAFAAASSAADELPSEARSGRMRQRSLDGRPRSGSATLSSSHRPLAVSASSSSGAVRPHESAALGGRPRAASHDRAGEARISLSEELTASAAASDGSSRGVAQLQQQLDRYACIIRTLEGRIRFGSMTSVAGAESEAAAVGGRSEDLQDRLRRSEEARQALEDALLAADRQAQTWLSAADVGIAGAAAVSAGGAAAATVAAAAAALAMRAPVVRDSGDGEGGAAVLHVAPPTTTRRFNMDSRDTGISHVGESAVPAEVRNICSNLLVNLSVVSDELRTMLAQDENGEVPCVDVTSERVTSLKQTVQECIAQLRYIGVLMDDEGATESTDASALAVGGSAAAAAAASSGSADRPGATTVSNGIGPTAVTSSNRSEQEPWSELQELYGELEQRAHLLGSANQRADELDCEVQRLTDEVRLKDELISQLQEQVAELERQLAAAAVAVVAADGTNRPPTARSSVSAAAGAAAGSKVIGAHPASFLPDVDTASSTRVGTGDSRHISAPAPTQTAAERSSSIADGSDDVGSYSYPAPRGVQPRVPPPQRTQQPLGRRQQLAFDSAAAAAGTAAADPVSSSGADDDTSLSAARSDRNVLSGRYLAAAALGDGRGSHGDNDDSGSDAGSLVSEALSEGGSQSSRAAISGVALRSSAAAVIVAAPKQVAYAQLPAAETAHSARLASYRSAGGSSSGGGPLEKEQLRHGSESSAGGGGSSSVDGMHLLGSAMFVGYAPELDKHGGPVIGTAPVSATWDLEDLITIDSGSTLSSRRTSCSSVHRGPIAPGRDSNGGIQADRVTSRERALGGAAASGQREADDVHPVHHKMLDVGDTFLDERDRVRVPGSSTRPAAAAGTPAAALAAALSPDSRVSFGNAAAVATSSSRAQLNRNGSAVDGALPRSSASTQTSDEPSRSPGDQFSPSGAAPSTNSLPMYGNRSSGDIDSGDAELRRVALLGTRRPGAGTAPASVTSHQPAGDACDSGVAEGARGELPRSGGRALRSAGDSRLPGETAQNHSFAAPFSTAKERLTGESHSSLLRPHGRISQASPNIGGVAATAAAATGTTASVGTSSADAGSSRKQQMQPVRQKLAMLSWDSDDAYDDDEELFNDNEYEEDEGVLRGGDGQEREDAALRGTGDASSGNRGVSRMSDRARAPPSLADVQRRQHQQPTDGVIVAAYERELGHLKRQLDAASELNATLREELELHETLWHQQQQQKSPEALPASPRKTATDSSGCDRGAASTRIAPPASTRQGESSQSLLNMHLDEIRALRERLEAAITNNNQLREELEKRLAADESQSADVSSAPAAVRNQASAVLRTVLKPARADCATDSGQGGSSTKTTDGSKTAALLKAAMMSLRRKKERLAALQTAERELSAALDACRQESASQLDAERERVRRLEANARRAQDEAAALRARQQRLDAELERARDSATALRSREQQLCNDLATAVRDADDSRRRETKLETDVAAVTNQCVQLEAELDRTRDELVAVRRREAALSSELRQAVDEMAEVRERASRTEALSLAATADAERERDRADRLEDGLRRAVAETETRERAMGEELRRAGTELEQGREREARLNADARRLARELAETTDRSRQLGAELKQTTDSLQAARAHEKQLAFDAEQAREDGAAAQARERRLEAELQRASEEAAAAAEREQRLTDELALVHRSVELRLDGELRRQRTDAESERARLSSELAAARSALAQAEERSAEAQRDRDRQQRDAEKETAALRQQALASAEDLLREVKTRDELLADRDRQLADRARHQLELESSWSRQKEDLLSQVAHKERSIKDLKSQLHRALEELEIVRDRVVETQGVNETLKFELSVLETLRPLGASNATAAGATAGSGRLASGSEHRLMAKDGGNIIDLTSFFDEMRRLREQLERSIEANNKLRIKLEESMIERRRRSRRVVANSDRIEDVPVDSSGGASASPSAVPEVHRGRAADTSPVDSTDNEDEFERDTSRKHAGQLQRQSDRGDENVAPRGSASAARSRSARRSLFSASPLTENDAQLLTLDDLDVRPSSAYSRAARSKGSGHAGRGAVSYDDFNLDGVRKSPDREAQGSRADSSLGRGRYGSVPSLVDRTLHRSSPDLKIPVYVTEAGNGESPRSHSVTRIDTEAQTLFAVCRLTDYELLKKENEQCLVTLSAAEARIQDRLDAFAASTAPSSGGSPGQSVEYSTLRELKHCVDELRGCLFEEKRLITLFWITRLPGSLPGERSASPELYLAKENKHMREELTQVRGKYRALQKMVGNLVNTVDKLEKSKTVKGADLANYVAQLTEINRVLGHAKRNLKHRAADD